MREQRQAATPRGRVGADVLGRDALLLPPMEALASPALRPDLLLCLRPQAGSLWGDDGQSHAGGRAPSFLSGNPTFLCLAFPHSRTPAVP